MCKGRGTLPTVDLVIDKEDAVVDGVDIVQ